MQNTAEESLSNGEGSYNDFPDPHALLRLLNIPALRTFLIGLVVWSLFILFLGLVQFSTPDLPDNDGFYHIKMAYLMRTEGLKPSFPWLPLTILNSREYYDHHFLFHVALIPFTYGDLRIGAKWASIFFASLAFLAVWKLFQNQRLPYAVLWSIGLLAVSEAFIYRMSIPRAQSLSLAVLVLGFNWLLARKHMRLFFLAFIYVWLYNAFPLLLGLAGLYVLSAWLLEHRLDLRPLLFTGAGIALGLVVNPYFPFNLVFAYQHILPKLLDATAVSVGSEWYPYDTGQLLSNSTLALLAFIAGVLALGLANRRMSLRIMLSFLLACLFGLMLFQSRRFIEYFPPFALIFAAFAWSPVITNYIENSPIKGLVAQKSISGNRKSMLAATILLLLLIPATWNTFQASKVSLMGSSPYQRYQGAAAWLASNTPEGERIFQTDWDDFPRLFFYNTHNTYLVGLDPTYMQLYSPHLYDLWVAITRGKISQPSLPISHDFGARYVMSDLLHEGFLNQAKNDPNLVEVYRDTDSVIFEVVFTPK